MTAASEIEIERSALRIPSEARLRLAAKLLASVPGVPQRAMSEHEALDLAEQRAAELDSDELGGIDYKAAMSRIRASLKQ